MDIIDVFVKGGYEVVVHPTQGAKDAEKMAKSMAEEVDLIVCSGGDGTLDEVVTGLMEIGANVPLGYIPAGSTNDFASSLAIPRDMVKAAQDIVDGHLFSVDVGSFNEDNFIYVAAFGMFTDVSYETSQDLKNILGHLAYVMEGAKRIFDVKTYHLCVEANGEVHEGDYIYGMITNSHSIGGFRNLVGNDVEMDDGLFEVTLIKKPKNVVELNQIMIFPSPWIGTPVIRIGPAAKSGFITIIDCRCTRPRHLEYNCLTEYTLVDVLTSGLRSHRMDSSNTAICTCQES